jgi:hypothetical protein
MSGVGSRAQVLHGTKSKTGGGLKKKDLTVRRGRILSKAKSRPVGKLGKNEFYCLSCRMKCKDVVGLKKVVITTKSGRKQHALTGKCNKCNTKVSKFVKAGSRSVSRKSSSRKSSPRKSSSRKSSHRRRSCRGGAINPKTKRCLSKGKVTYKKLMNLL